MNKNKLNAICTKIGEGHSWEYCKFGEWIIGDGLSPEHCVQKGLKIRLLKTPNRTCENCTNWKDGPTLVEENLVLGFCNIFKKQMYHNEGTNCKEFSKCE